MYVIIQARTKSAAVVIVGTHIDKMKNFGPKNEASFRKSINAMYSNMYKYPEIKAIEFVSCEDGYEKYIKNLRDTLYNIASQTKLSIGKSAFRTVGTKYNI